MTHWEYSELQKLSRDFDRALVDSMPQVRAVVAKGALNIKNGARERISGLAHAPAYPYSITYETRATATSAEAEIGPDKARPQGPLGNLLEYGSINNAPRPHHRPAADEELPKFEKYLEDLATKWWEGS